MYNKTININSVIMVLSLIASIFFGLLYSQTRKNFDDYIADIQAQDMQNDTQSTHLYEHKISVRQMFDGPLELNYNNEIHYFVSIMINHVKYSSSATIELEDNLEDFVLNNGFKLAGSELTDARVFNNVGVLFSSADNCCYPLGQIAVVPSYEMFVFNMPGVWDVNMPELSNELFSIVAETTQIF